MENHHFNTDGSMTRQMNEKPRCTQQTERQTHKIHPWHNAIETVSGRKVLTVPCLTDHLK